MQKPIDAMMPNLSKPAFPKAGAASDYKASSKEEDAPKGLGNPFSHLLSHILKARTNAQPTKNQPEAEKNADLSIQAQASDAAPPESTLESAINAQLSDKKPLAAKPGIPLATNETLASESAPETEVELATSSTGNTPLDASALLPGLNMGLNTESNAASTKHAERDTTTDAVNESGLPSAMTATLPADLLLSLQQAPTLGLAQPIPSSITEGKPVALPTGLNANPIQTLASEAKNATSAIPISMQSLLAKSPQVPVSTVNSKPGKHNDAMAASNSASEQLIQPDSQLPGPAQPELSKLQLPNTALSTLPEPKGTSPQPSSPEQPQAQREAALVPSQIQPIQLPPSQIALVPLSTDTIPLNFSHPISLPVSQPTDSPSQGWATHGPQSPLPGPGTRPGTEGASVPAPHAKDTALTTAFADIQTQLNAMGGTIESVAAPDNAPTPNLVQAPLLPELMKSPAKPDNVSLSMALDLHQLGNPQMANPLSNTSPISSTAANMAVAGISRTSPLEIGHTILHGLPKLGLSGKDTDSDNSNGLDGGLAIQATPTPGGATDSAGTTSDLAASNILPTAGNHQTIATASADGVPQFVSSAQHPTDQVADGTIYSAKNGHKELIIRLNPDNLGEVRINLTSHGNQELSARMIASTQESHDLLKGQLDTLKQRLESQGIQVDRLSVVMAGSAESQAHTGHGHQQAFQHETFTPQHSAQSQQWTNQDQQTNQGTFAQMHSQFQQKQGMSQPHAQRQFTGNAQQPTGTFPDSAQKPDNPGQDNANGRISILV